MLNNSIVAPHTGAWIETGVIVDVAPTPKSHPTRVRGLKHAPRQMSMSWLVAPHTGAWIETHLLPVTTRRQASHPTRVRGLKRVIQSAGMPKGKSHPTRVRGLKRFGSFRLLNGGVAPHTGAWIETSGKSPKAAYQLSHPTRVRGLKHQA